MRHYDRIHPPGFPEGRHRVRSHTAGSGAPGRAGRTDDSRAGRHRPRAVQRQAADGEGRPRDAEAGAQLGLHGSGGRSLPGQDGGRDPRDAGRARPADAEHAHRLRAAGQEPRHRHRQREDAGRDLRRDGVDSAREAVRPRARGQGVGRLRGVGQGVAGRGTALLLPRARLRISAEPRRHADGHAPEAVAGRRRRRSRPTCSGWCAAAAIRCS